MSLKSRSKAHTRYYTKDETLVVGVTTVMNLEAKPFLIPWANRLGLEGIDSNKFKDNAARIGTLAHYLVECDLKGKKPDLAEYSDSEYQEAIHPFNKWKMWLNEQKDFEFISSEMGLVSEKFKYGGTLDILAKVNGKVTLIDLKTSGSIYDSHKTQLAAYRYLLLENNQIVDDCRILRIGKGKTGGFEDVRVNKIEKRFEKFLILLNLYNINKEIGG